MNPPEKLINWPKMFGWSDNPVIGDRPVSAQHAITFKEEFSTRKTHAWHIWLEFKNSTREKK